MNREPFVKLQPVFKDYLWGGNRLSGLYGMKQQQIAEAWLLSVHPDGQNRIAEGSLQGKTLCQTLPEESQGAFPILIKLIDSAQKLSVQVHPDNEYARIHENDNGKSEMWMVLDAAPDAYLYVGFSRKCDTAEIRQRIENGTIEEILQKVPTHPGDIVYIPAGTVHAIGEGNLILEVQQSSNATYRLYDYQRRGKDGKLRPLHIDKALDVLIPDQAANSVMTGNPQHLECEYFTVEKLAVSKRCTLPMTNDRFVSVVCVNGEGTLEREGKQTGLQQGDSLYLPQGNTQAVFTGDMQLVITRAAL